MNTATQPAKDKTRDDPVTDSISHRWVWMLDIIFGATAAFGFENLQQSIRVAIDISAGEVMKQVLVASSLYVFLLYDVTAVHVLTKKYPYRLSRYSSARYFLDIVMGFLLMLMLIPGTQSKPEESTLVILVALSLWHAGAFFWHLLANIELGHRVRWESFIPHFAYIAIYWLVFGAWYIVQTTECGTVDYRSTSLLYAISAAVVVIALYRLRGVIDLCK